MKKWTYLVAALLLSGTTATLTSCLDNDEPVGIQNLRGAKAELLKAQASLKLAEAANETAQAAWTQAKADWEQTQVELQKIEIQKQQLTLELQQAQNEYDKQRIQNALNDLKRTEEGNAEQHKKNMLDLQVKTAQAEAAYNLALKEIQVSLLTIDMDATDANGNLIYKSLKGYYDHMVTAKEELYGDGVPGSAKTNASVMKKYEDALNNLAEATLNHTKAYDKVSIENTVAYYQRKLDAQKKIAEKNLQIFDGTSIESWVPKLEALEKESKDMRVKYGELYVRDSVLERELDNAKLEYTKVFQGATGEKGVKNDYILTAAKYNDIKSTYETKEAEIDKKYATDELEYKYELPEAIRKDVLTKDQIAQGKTAYVSDYDGFMNDNSSDKTVFDKYVIAENELPQANQNLAVLKVENDKLAADYKATIAKWTDARDKYNTAALAYGWSNDGAGSSLKYKETKEVLDAKKNIAADKWTMEDTKDVASAMGKYLRLRYPFDGYKQTYKGVDAEGKNVDKDWADLLTATVENEDLEKALNGTDFMTKMVSLLGTNNRNSTSTEETKVGYPLFAETSTKALGAVRYAEYSEAEIKAALNSTTKKINSSWGLFSDSYNKNVDYTVLKTSVDNREVWIAFTNNIKTQAKAWEAFANAKIKDMDEMLAKLVADNAALTKKLDDKTEEYNAFAHDVAVIKAEQEVIDNAIALLKQYITKNSDSSDPLINKKDAAELEEYVADMKAKNAYGLAQYESYLEKAQNMKKLFDEGAKLEGTSVGTNGVIIGVESSTGIKIKKYELDIKQAELTEWEKNKKEAEEELAMWTDTYKKAIAIYTGSTQE